MAGAVLAAFTLALPFSIPLLAPSRRNRDVRFPPLLEDKLPSPVVPPKRKLRIVKGDNDRPRRPRRWRPRHRHRQPWQSGEDGSVIVGKILEKDQYSFGFDGQTGEYGNLVTKGIIDPTKVVRVAIQTQLRLRRS